MPGLVLFKRRWSVGSDDLVVPAIILFTIHLIWLCILSIVLIIVDYRFMDCMADLFEHTVGYVVILIGCVIVEGFIACVSMRGSILNPTPRTSMKYFLYIRLGILLIEIVWLIVGAIRLPNQAMPCEGLASDALLGVTICNWCVVGFVLITIWCTFDAAGRSWVKMKVYQNSLKEGHSKYRYRRSENSQRNWRHRKAVREYQDSWNRRCRLLFCCVGQSDRQQNSFTEIAKLLSEFFRDLDVVPSDVIAGLILLRRHQKTQRQLIVDKRKNDTFQFLSGVAVTSSTKFLDVNHPIVAEEIRTLVHFLHYGLAVYGWPVFMMMNSATGCCQLFPNMKCCAQSPFCCFQCSTHNHGSDGRTDFVVEDNCCQCNYAALRNICQTHNYEMIYATYHVAIGEPPFFVALDFDKKSVVISVRGTLSLHDVITDLNAEGELLPTNPMHEDWLGHKGMVEAAVYIKNKLKDEQILTKALNYCPEKGTQTYNIVLVGHSLGAGTAAILSILLKEEFPDLVCFAFAPPGGLLSAPALEYTKDFIISIVLGKDVVPRLGLHQMETLRFDLINAIKQSQDPKWKIIGGGVQCCCPQKDSQLDINEINVEDVDSSTNDKELSAHPNDDSIALTVHSPLYPPGRIIHLVRNHPKKSEQVVGKKEPVFQALWADNTNFNQIIISPVMIQDHMPDKMLDALEKLLVHTGPAKPQRKPINDYMNDSSNRPLLTNSGTLTPNSLDINSTHNIVLETSFTDSPLIAQNAQNAKRLIRRPVRPTQFNNKTDFSKVDLMRDDWFGAAPLASPETMSDISSVSSRSTSFRTSWGLLPVFTLTDRSVVDQKPISQQPNGKYSKFAKEQIAINFKDELNIPLVDNDTQINANINNIEFLNKRSCDSQKALNLKLMSSNDTIEDNVSPKNGLYELLEVKDENYNSSAHSSDNNVQDMNFGEIQNSRCESINENESLPPLHRYSSDTDINNYLEAEVLPLRRSYEEIHLNNLDDTARVFETESLNLNSEQNCSQNTNEGEISPTLRMLFHKLLTIESPTTESAANQSTCDSDVNANQISSPFNGNQF